MQRSLLNLSSANLGNIAVSQPLVKLATYLLTEPIISIGTIVAIFVFMGVGSGIINTSNLEILRNFTRLLVSQDRYVAAAFAVAFGVSIMGLGWVIFTLL